MKVSIRSEETLENTRVNQQNMLAFSKLTAEHVPEVEFLEENGVQASMSRLKLPGMNGINPLNVQEDELEDTILHFTDLYLAQNLRPKWRVWDMDAYMTDYLEALNYRKSGYKTAMSMDLENWMVVSTVPSELSVRKVDDEETCRHYARLLAESRNIPKYDIAGFQDFVSSVGCDQSSPLHHYVAYEKCEPVAILSLFYSENSVGIYNIQTVQEKGNATSHLMIHAIKEAQESGAQKAILQTEDTSVQIYERIGFQNDGNILEYQMS